MKIDINKELVREDGVTTIIENGNNLTLKQICISAMLIPVTDQYNAQGALVEKGDDDKTKLEKWDIFKNFRDAQSNIIDLTSEEITILKKWIGKFQPQLIYGQCNEILEQKL